MRTRSTQRKRQELDNEEEGYGSEIDPEYDDERDPPEDADFPSPDFAPASELSVKSYTSRLRGTPSPCLLAIFTRRVSRVTG